ncbi:hypothetical protein E3P99_03034 [Wallemia hederae]|uniref:Uncharacterized protein n=1 Tax=Wallemia hederae TaxID=1540922 RepID=A0A4T0FI70_9BASI|nr:hypothetical protein E3P99_03034 [Wallemia hederae]
MPTIIPVYSSSTHNFDPLTAYCPELSLTVHSTVTATSLILDVLHYNETVASMAIEEVGESGRATKSLHMMPETGYSALSASPARLCTRRLDSIKCVGNVIRSHDAVLASFHEKKVTQLRRCFRAFTAYTPASTRSDSHTNTSTMSTSTTTHCIALADEECVDGVECFVLFVCRKLFADVSHDKALVVRRGK